LAERIALVTGGGRGIGANVARALAEDGWSVVVAARTRGQVEAVAAEIVGRALELDVSSPESVARAFAEAGDVELLVANAGIAGERRPTWELDPANWWRVFEVNVLGAFLCCRAAIPGMLARGCGRNRQRRERRRLPARGVLLDRVPGEQGGAPSLQRGHRP
jgi:NAD(P)-dependent dehydrogenase (short-subunit alcohol dehydrogenase family)